MRVAEDARPVPGSLVFSVNVEVAPGKFAFVTSNQLYCFRDSSPGAEAAPTDRQNGTPAAAAPHSPQPAAGEGKAEEATPPPTPAAVRPWSLEYMYNCISSPSPPFRSTTASYAAHSWICSPTQPAEVMLHSWFEGGRCHPLPCCYSDALQMLEDRASIVVVTQPHPRNS